ncbi:MAG TPA: TIR domain-containing protein [Steroidobacteraceae bacterium]|nr:TIR domain-containing protein [Steroidobacteraceae bacterium]
MAPEPSKAVFLSYASEDAQAALRLCAGLRQAGIEVWFDQSELRGGDAWDAAIRRQIRTCALFIPVISRNTHARGEGYFRLEWKLAIDRSHLMAGNVPFLLPVAIDDTANTDERVPERFCEVQWTRLPDGVPSAAFIERVRRLLAPPDSAAQRDPGRSPARAAGLGSAALVPGVLRAALIGLVVLGIGYAAIERLVLPKGVTPAAAVSQARAPSPGAIPEQSVAVLPFTDVSQQRDQAYFSDGLSEELINQLSRIPALRVPARRSSFSFKGKSDDIATIAQRLRVAYVLEGSVRKSGTQLRVTAELIRAGNGYHVWSETYDTELKDVFKVQDELASAVTTALKLRLAPLQRTAAQNTSSAEAYNDYLQARELYARGAGDDYAHAIEYLHKAIALDPNYAAAYADLALAEFSLADRAGDPQGAQRALEAADKAVALAPEAAAGYSARGFIRSNFSWDWNGAQSDFRKALELEPNDAEVQDNYAQLLQSLGRLPEAIAAARKATELDPLSGPAWENLARFLTDNRDYAAARAANAHALEFSPEGIYALNDLGTLQLLGGSPADALRTFRRIGFEGFRLQGVAMAEHSLGNVKESQQALDDLIAKYAKDGPYEIADIYAWRGEKQQAFLWLERAYTQRDGGLSNLKSDPLLASLRTDARYEDLLKKLNLPRTLAPGDTP